MRGSRRRVIELGVSGVAAARLEYKIIRKCKPEELDAAELEEIDKAHRQGFCVNKRIDQRIKMQVQFEAMMAELKIPQNG